MIATFPSFSNLTIETRADIEAFTKTFEPYSDFNFTSLLCWNINDSTAVSNCNGNLVIRFPDYLSGEPIYTFIGNENVTDTLLTILGTVNRLELVPESAIHHIDTPELFVIKEDTDQFDYIYSTEDHARLQGGRFKSKRKLLGRFIRNHGHRTIAEEINFQDPKTTERIQHIFDEWAQQKNTSQNEAAQERIALKRLIEHAHHFDLSGHIVHIDEKSVGFSVTEVLENEFAIYHFQKTLKDYEFLDIHLTRISSEHLFRKGAKYINWEQDLGIPGLRHAKTNYKPVRMLKKYSIELRE